MNHRDLYFATYHQAAHVVTALVLGCRVDSVDVSPNHETVVWNLDSASLADTETVCAAGFEMERILGRLHDLAWTKADTDRTLLGTILEDRTGLSLTAAELDDKFMSGALSSRPILEHTSTRNAIDQLAESLGDAYNSGKTPLLSAEIKTITGLAIGSPVS